MPSPIKYLLPQIRCFDYGEVTTAGPDLFYRDGPALCVQEGPDLFYRESPALCVQEGPDLFYRESPGTCPGLIFRGHFYRDPKGF